MAWHGIVVYFATIPVLRVRVGYKYSAAPCSSWGMGNAAGLLGLFPYDSVEMPTI